jgi:hypothetical protein
MTNSGFTLYVLSVLKTYCFVRQHDSLRTYKLEHINQYKVKKTAPYNIIL